MSLHQQLLQRARQGRPIRIGLIGAGKFGAMYLAQVPRMPGVHLVAIADLSPDNARASLARFVAIHPDIPVPEDLQPLLR